MSKGNNVENIIIYPNRSDVSRQFHIVYFTAKYLCHDTKPAKFTWIRVYPILTAVLPIILQ
jgi:hypothetical protein